MCKPFGLSSEWLFFYPFLRIQKEGEDFEDKESG